MTPVLVVRVRTDGRYDWHMGARRSTLGYITPDEAISNARWNDIDFDQVDVRTRTSAQERAHGEALIWECEHK